MISYVRSELSAQDCQELGFNKASLLCNSCDLLEKYELGVLKTNCKECCNQAAGEGDKVIKRYPKARLEVCG